MLIIIVSLLANLNEALLINLDGASKLAAFLKNTNPTGSIDFFRPSMTILWYLRASMKFEQRFKVTGSRTKSFSNLKPCYLITGSLRVKGTPIWIYEVFSSPFDSMYSLRERLVTPMIKSLIVIPSSFDFFLTA